ncbi:hypothetical protein FOA52_002629 [Chlamydomonas sp. UWO 241]|nr:hypothetical protein FOA52_002629 [Chlamydomonas sp. UWO 241]
MKREIGLAGLWRGNLPYMLRHVPSTSLSFSLKDALLATLPHPGGTHEQEPAAHLARNMAAGGLAGAAALAVVYPLDFTSIRMAANLAGAHPKLLAELRAGAAGGGPRQWFRGFGVSALAIGSYKALYFGLWDSAKAHLGVGAIPHGQRAKQPQGQGEGYEQEQGQQQHGLRAEKQQQQEGQGQRQGQQQQQGWDDGQERGEGQGQQQAQQQGQGQRQGQQEVRHGGQQQQAQQQAQPTPLGLISRWLVASGVVMVASTLTFPLDLMRKRLVVDTLLPADKRQYQRLVVDTLLPADKRQ